MVCKVCLYIVPSGKYSDKQEIYSQALKYLIRVSVSLEEKYKKHLQIKCQKNKTLVKKIKSYFVARQTKAVENEREFGTIPTACSKKTAFRYTCQHQELCV